MAPVSSVTRVAKPTANSPRVRVAAVILIEFELPLSYSPDASFCYRSHRVRVAAVVLTGCELPLSYWYVSATVLTELSGDVYSFLWWVRRPPSVTPRSTRPPTEPARELLRDEDLRNRQYEFVNKLQLYHGTINGRTCAIDDMIIIVNNQLQK